MKRGSNHRYIGRTIGLVDEATVAKARAAGIENIAGGSINKRDRRTRLFVPAFPGAHRSGFALRSRVVWWLNTGEVIRGLEANIHHKNHDRADDKFKNLEKMDHAVHGHLHNPKTVEMSERTCRACGGKFTIEKWRLKEESRGSFCSQECYHATPKQLQRAKLKCEECANPFFVIPNRAQWRRFCSRACSATYNWRQRRA